MVSCIAFIGSQAREVSKGILGSHGMSQHKYNQINIGFDVLHVLWGVICDMCICDDGIIIYIYTYMYIYIYVCIYIYICV